MSVFCVTRRMSRYVNLLDTSKIRELTGQTAYYLHSERIRVTEVPPATCIQITCSTAQSGATIDPATLEAYFSNGRYTGVRDSESLKHVKLVATLSSLPVFVATYSSPQG